MFDLFINSNNILNFYYRPAFYKLIEECVSQIVLHRNGYDPDFRATKRFQLDVQPLINTVIGKQIYELNIIVKVIHL